MIVHSVNTVIKELKSRSYNYLDLKFTTAINRFTNSVNEIETQVSAKTKEF